MWGVVFRANERDEVGWAGQGEPCAHSEKSGLDSGSSGGPRDPKQPTTYHLCELGSSISWSPGILMGETYG